MQKSMSVNQTCSSLCADLRRRYFGDASTAQDYKDSYIINKAIDLFADDENLLMSEELSLLDMEPKTSKSIVFRSDAYDKLSTISRCLGIGESEALRRILFFSRSSPAEHGAPRADDLSELKEKLEVLREQMRSSMAALDDLALALHMLEQQEE